MSRPDPETSTPRALRVAVDTGGTFTDLICQSGGTLRVLKVPSTPDDPAAAIFDGLRRLVEADRPFELLHGSTVATNALLERKGARVVLITNRDFEDVLAIGRQNRPQLYALVGHRPPPLVPRDRRVGIAGRIDADGSERAPLDPTELATLPDRLRDLGAQSVAITMLHSYRDARHETAVAEVVATAGLPVSVSAELLPEYREYERTSTTVVNAYVAPVMERYLGALADGAGASRVTVMGSNGGTLDVARARREPVHTVLSGPAGGVVGALAWARRAGHERIVTFDMGGTSTDVSLCPGTPLHTREFEIDGHPVAIPVLDIHTVGAGGGSLATVDPGGALRVGPESAGARPGPIAYGRGGQGLTVTDAHVWLGRIPTDAFLGGEVVLDRNAVRGPLEDLARSLGATPDEAAEGIVRVADTAMERALRVISVERGHDPADLALVAFGGAGGLHAAELTTRLGAARALIPPNPGLLSAWGILNAPLSREVSRTLLAPSNDPETPERVEAALADLEARARQALEQDGVAPGECLAERSVDARYRGQSFELRVPAEDWTEAFHGLHERRYGYRRDDTPVEAVTVRVRVLATTRPIEPPPLGGAAGPPEARVVQVVYGGRTVDARGVWRQKLATGHRLSGPAIVLDYSATVWVPPEWHLEVDRWGVLTLTP